MNEIIAVTNGSNRNINIIRYSCMDVVEKEFVNTPIASEGLNPETRSMVIINDKPKHIQTKNRTTTFI